MDLFFMLVNSAILEDSLGRYYKIHLFSGFLNNLILDVLAIPTAGFILCLDTDLGIFRDLIEFFWNAFAYILFKLLVINYIFQKILYIYVYFYNIKKERNERKWTGKYFLICVTNLRLSLPT